MKKEYVPGEWIAFFKHKYQEWHVSVPVANSKLRYDLFPDGVPGECLEEKENRAKLISVAPDLLEACKLIEMFCENNGSPCDGFRFREGIKKARQAIAKLEKREK